MSSETIDLGEVIAVLEGKRAALDSAIIALKAVVASGAAGPTPDGTVINVSNPFTPSGAGEIPDGAFNGKSMPAAIKLYLEIMRSKKTAREISCGVKKGGLESTSKFFDKIVYATLDRLRKAGEIVKIGTAWGLPSWYPALMRAGVADATKSSKRARGRPRKVVPKTKGPKLVSTCSSRGAKPKGQPKSTDVIDLFLRNNPSPHTSEEIRVAARMGNLRVTEMLLGRMIKSGKVQKTEDGKYRKAS